MTNYKPVVRFGSTINFGLQSNLNILEAIAAAYPGSVWIVDGDAKCVRLVYND